MSSRSATRIQIDGILSIDVAAKVDRIVAAVAASDEPRAIAVHRQTPASRFLIARLARLDGVRVRVLEPSPRRPTPEGLPPFRPRRGRSRPALFAPWRPVLVVVDDPASLGTVLRRTRRDARATLHVGAPQRRERLLDARVGQDVASAFAGDRTCFSWCISEDPVEVERYEAWFGAATGPVPRDTTGGVLQRQEFRCWAPDCPPDLLGALLY